MSILLSPINLNGLTLKNRIVMSPMCMYSVDRADGIPTPFHFAHYGARAIGGVGLIILEATAVNPEGRLTKNDLGLWNDEQLNAMKSLVHSLHQLGAKVGVQLVHAGRKAADTAKPLAPSALDYDHTFTKPCEMSSNDIQKTINDFKAAAHRAQLAGFDMIEIHGAHGYLINQFLEPATNLRNDAYGGTLDNRYRLLHEIIQATKTVFKQSIWVRLSVDAYLSNDQQNSIADYQYIAQQLEKDGVTALDISTGGLCPVRPNIELTTGYQVPFAQAIKSAVSIPVGAVGLLDDAEFCEKLLADEKVDFILQGRALLRNPQWPTQASIALADTTFQPYNNSYKRAY